MVIPLHQTANPINWAGYVLIGNYDPIELDRKVLLWGIPFWYYVGFIGFVISLVVLIKKFWQ